MKFDITRQLAHLLQLVFASEEDGCGVALLLDSAEAAAFHLGHIGQVCRGSLYVPPRPWII